MTLLYTMSNIVGEHFLDYYYYHLVYYSGIRASEDVDLLNNFQSIFKKFLPRDLSWATSQNAIQKTRSPGHMIVDFITI